MARTLTYAGKNLSDFSVWWDNSRIFNKPAKLFDSFSIPNRNGALLSSLNRFENIQIEYDCYIKDNFAQNYNDLVDFLTSFDTYQRLENSEEPLTYRMGIFRAELSTDTGQFLKTGQFTIVFDCKPQNFFNSGETPIRLSLYNGSTDGQNQWLGSDMVLGDVALLYSSLTKTYQIYGDLGGSNLYTSAYIPIPSAGVWAITLTVESGGTDVPDRVYISIGSSQEVAVNTGNTLTYQYTATEATTILFKVRVVGGASATINKAISAQLYKTSTNATTFVNPSAKEAKPIIIYKEIGSATSVTINSQKVFEYSPPQYVSNADGDLYVDCELMDCYLLRPDGTVFNANPYVTIGEFPLLTKGTNTGYATSGTVDIVPRWWRL